MNKWIIAFLSSPIFFSCFSYANHIPALDKDAASMPKMLTPFSGLYGGGSIGVVKHTMNITDNQATSFNATIQESSNPQLSGGLQIGVRRQTEQEQISGVYGLEFSTNFSQARFEQNYGSPYAIYEIAATNELKNLYLLQLTGGIAIHKTLLFLAAGFSWANLTSSMASVTGTPYFVSFNSQQITFGTALSVGVEYAFYDRLTMRLKIDAMTPNTYTVADNLANNFQISNFIVQGLLGINYKITKS